MATRFSQIFWGLLLVVLDFKINHFDVLPDFIGYVLVAIGCNGLVVASQRFRTASILGWVLAVLSILGLAVRGDAATLFSLVNLAADCAMMWSLLGGVMELAITRRRPDLCERASNRRIAYVAVMCVATFAGLIAQGARDLAVILVVGVIVVILPLLVLILHLIHRVKHELTDGPTL